MRLNPNIQIQILELDKTPDEYGEPSNEWTPIFSGIFAEVSPILGRELFEAYTAGSSIETKIRCRWFDGVTDNMRVRTPERDYDIISVIDVNSQHRELLMYCKAVRSDG
jgi:SPP1 family predicted phage head-tail adaptor